jgi:hypothetical protein
MKKLNSKELQRIILEEVEFAHKQRLNEANKSKENQYIINKVDTLEKKIDQIIKLLKTKK